MLFSAWLPTAAAAAGGEGGPGTAGASGEAGTPGLMPVPVQPPGSVPGIDVSHHQGVIDWAQVAASGQRFAIAKATEGQTFVDPMYATNKVEAETFGIAFSAYHFARPDAQPDDAIVEADHFVDTAQLEPGNLVPALDVERTGGLSPEALTQWILTWLDRVTARLGVRPMVYTSPAGWETRTADTTAIADAGYSVLWIAHWNVDVPRLPAGDWSGNGWAFWQYGDCGTVPGITGCVDVDWYESSVFDAVAIPSPDVTPPAVTLATPTDVDGEVEVSFSEIVHQVTPENTYVWTPETGTYPEVGLTCTNAAGAEVDCVGGKVRTAVVQPLAPLVPGEDYQAVVNPGVVPTAVVDRSGNPALTTTQDFAAPTEVGETSPAITYDWRTAANRHAYGRSYAVADGAGASVSFAFTGRSVTWYTVTGPAEGKASVRIDGRWVGTFDQYAPGTGFKVARAFTGLERGPHTIDVRVLGEGSPAAGGTQVAVDAFGTPAGIAANPDLDASWGRLEAGRASGGALAASDLARSSAELTFRGTGVAWQTARGRDQGRAEVWVDGLLVRTVDNFAPERMFGVERRIAGLADGIHTLRIVVLGEARGAATGTMVSIDGFSVIA